MKSIMWAGVAVRRVYWVVLAVLLWACVPSGAWAGSWAFGMDMEVLLLGNSQLQWTVDSERGPKTYALTGQARMGMAPGLAVWRIFNNNLILAGAMFYRSYAGTFQSPSIYGEDAEVSFKELAFIGRIGYSDFYDIPAWTPSPFSGETPAHGFGHIRLGVIQSNINSSPEFEDFDASTQALVGIEYGALYLPGETFYVGLSGFVDYTFGIVPFSGETDTGVDNDILLNTLFFGFAIHSGVVTDPPR